MYPTEFDIFDRPNAHTFADRAVIAIDTSLYMTDSKTVSIYDLAAQRTVQHKAVLELI